MKFGFFMVILATLLVPYTVFVTNARKDLVSSEKYPTSTKVAFTSTDERNMESKISKNAIVEDVDIYTSGRVIYVAIEYTDDVSTYRAKTHAESVLEYFDEDVVDYYDVYFTLDVDDELIEGVDDGLYYIDWD